MYNRTAQHSEKHQNKIKPRSFPPVLWHTERNSWKEDIPIQGKTAARAKKKQGASPQIF